MKNTKGASCCL